MKKITKLKEVVCDLWYLDHMLNRWPSHGHWPHSSAAEVSQSTHLTLSLQYSHADMPNMRGLWEHINTVYIFVFWQTHSNISTLNHLFLLLFMIISCSSLFGLIVLLHFSFLFELDQTAAE